jgi:pseudouridine-5'-phosphate glycosidase
MSFDYLMIAEEVKHALEHGIPVVALESTIISHGMPYPKNIEVALAVEKVIRDNGCVPATIGIICGQCIIGLSQEQIHELGTSHHVVKVSRRDLPYVVSNHLNGSTTVAATMILAHQAHIDVFVTGGIGGVHRDGQITFDISTELTELARTDVIVVCAGAKAILDLNLTLEYLETQGVPVIGYQSTDFGAFYSHSSGIKLEYNMNANEIAQFVETKRAIGLQGGVMISNPIPIENEIPKEEIDCYIEEAIRSCKQSNIIGKHITPYLLDYLNQKTQGRSLEANISLILHNAYVGSLIAKALKSQS